MATNMLQFDLWHLSGIAVQSLVGAILALLAYAGLAPTKLGERFLNHHLERKLEALRHDQNGQIEELKAKLSILGDRGVRSNEREFEALIAAWESFEDAYITTKRCAMAAYSHPDLSTASDEDVTAYLSVTEFSDVQKLEVIKATDKNRAVSKIIQFRQIADAQRAIYESHSTLRKRGIFIPYALKQSFLDALKMLTGAQVQRSMEFHDRGSGRELKAVDALFSDGEKIFEDLEASVRARLHLDSLPLKATNAL